MKKVYLLCMLAAGGCVGFNASAQLSSNPDKFLGNITTWGSVDTDGLIFSDLWNQLTPENETKWESIEGTRDQYNWWGADNCYNYCQEKGLPFKFHTMVWGSQYPKWMNNLAEDVQYEEIIEWYDQVKERYPELDMIDVVNEAINGHAPAPFKNALGGDGVTGYDWIIKAFELAYERWPNAILIYNDYNTFQWQKTEFIDLVKAVRDAGAPIDAYGCQSHDLTDIDFNTFKRSMAEIQDALQMPMYSSEYDIGTADDNKQLKQYKDQIQYMWEQDYVAGITLWGYIYGKTWVTDGNSGIIKDGKDRPAMEWLREYMASEEAQATPSPYKAMKKEASLYIMPDSPVGFAEAPNNITLRASLATKTIDKIELYINGELAETLTEAPYIVEYTPAERGKVELKAVMYDTEGNTYQRIGGFLVYGQRQPYNGTPAAIPGIIQAEDFDICGEGISFHDSDKIDEGGANYRTDNEGMDIGKGNGGCVIGYTAEGEWLEYTVDVQEAGEYEYEAVVSCGTDAGAAFTISIKEDNNYKKLASVNIPRTTNWDTYTTVSGKFKQALPAGQQVLRITIDKPYGNIDYISIVPTAGINGISGDKACAYQVYTTTGILVGEVVGASEYSIGEEIMKLTSRSGIYVLRNSATGQGRKIAVGQ